MKTRLLVVSAFLLLGACKDKDTKTLVLAGDSWASFLCIHQSFKDAFNSAALEKAQTNTSCPLTSKIGLRADNWLASDAHQRTLDSLKDESVKVLYLSMGGNDFIKYWNKNLTQQEEEQLFDKIKDNINQAIKLYQAEHPDLKILVSGYDYPRFTADHPIKDYREAYESMGSPSPLELNKALIRFTENLLKVADQKSVFFIHHLGLMHYYFGNTETGLAPFTTLEPDLISSADHPERFGGNENHQNDPEALLQVGSVVDAFHLSKSGFDKLAYHTVMQYLKDWLK